MTDNMRLHNIPDEFSKKLEIELGATNWLIPEPDIYDEPTRCHKINLEWSPIVMGMVSLLTEVGAWKEAQDENYPPIIMVRRFLQGVECMTYNLRQSPTDDCILQESTDGGETWTDVFDFGLCLAPHIETINNNLLNIELQNITNSGYSPTETTTAGENGTYTPEELAEKTVEADTCDTTGKNKIYGAVSRLVDYIHNTNVDFLQNVAQGANAAEQLKRLISAAPVVGLLPADEAVEYVGFLIDELLAEYNATVDEALLQEVKCELFCQAVNSGCVFSLGDVYDFFGSHVDPSLSTVSNTLTNLIQFALTGTFTGDEYFYFMSWFQLTVAGASQKFLNINSVAAYEQQMAAGFNSPSNDWATFCVDCPDHYRIWTWDFTTQGQGEWYLDPAADATPPGQFIEGIGWKATPDPTNPRLRIAMPWHPSWEILAVGAEVDWTFATHGGARSWVLRPTKGSTAGQSALALSNGTGDYEWCKDSMLNSGYTEMALDAFVSNAAGHVIIEKIAVVFSADAAKPGAIITEDNTLC